MVKRILFFRVFVWVSTLAFGKEGKLYGPDRKLCVIVSDERGMPSYSALYEDVTSLQESPLGIETNLGDFAQQMALANAGQLLSVNEEYQLFTIRNSNPQYQTSVQTYIFFKEEKRMYDTVLQVSNHDMAFEYRIYPQDNALCYIVKKEATEFVPPKGSMTFLCPQTAPMGGFVRTSPSYEASYAVDDMMGKNGWGDGCIFPCLFRNEDKGWILISETGASSAYCGSRLLGRENGLYAISFPQEGGYNGNGTVPPGMSLSGETPWRIATVGRTLVPIVETVVVLDVTKPLYETLQEFQYGCGTWGQIIGGDDSMNYDEQKRHTDFSADISYSSVLVNALWDSWVGRDRIAELADYVASKGVALHLWHDSSGYWNDVPQSPGGTMNNTIVRREEMKRMQSIGIRRIKVDFIGSDKQITTQLYEDILANANDYGLMVIFHGCTLPHGWEWMHPSFVACEAVLASENLHFSQGSCDAEPFNTCLHLFIRDTVGSIDFGGSVLSKYYNAGNEPGSSCRITSDAFALVMAVLFQSPVQHFALAPNNLIDAPVWAMDFMRTVPSVWDEVKFIDGYPGKYILFTRCHADTWYIAGVNAQKEPSKLKVKLPTIEAGKEVKAYSDNKDLEGGLQTIKLNKKQEVQIITPCNGGMMIVG